SPELHPVHLLFLFNDPPPPTIYTLSLHDALPIFNSNYSIRPRGARLGRRCLRKPDGKQYGCWRDCCASTSEEAAPPATERRQARSEEHTSELQSRGHLVCRLLLEKKNNMNTT